MDPDQHWKNAEKQQEQRRLTVRPQLPFREGQIVYVRARVKRKASDKTFGQWEIEPIDRFAQPTSDGKYLYADSKELITIEDARRMVQK